jgi:hypothetical protein
MRILLFVSILLHAAAEYVAGRAGTRSAKQECWTYQQERRWLIDRGNAVWTSERKQGVAKLGADALADGVYVATAFDAVGEDLAGYTFRVRR